MPRIKKCISFIVINNLYFHQIFYIVRQIWLNANRSKIFNDMTVISEHRDTRTNFQSKGNLETVKIVFVKCRSIGITIWQHYFDKFNWSSFKDISLRSFVSPIHQIQNSEISNLFPHRKMCRNKMLKSINYFIRIKQRYLELIKINHKLIYISTFVVFKLPPGMFFLRREFYRYKNKTMMRRKKTGQEKKACTF